MIRAAAYCRVSTDREDQANSFESQRRYFREYIDRRPDWELYRIYADEGVTGTSTKKRAAFNRMIDDARQGRFQVILTKEVSRFSRNILDTISRTRELKALGVGVVFLNDGINTLDPDAELRLSIMGSIAQEESRRTSSRVKWGQTRRMEQGVVFGRSLLGYNVRGGRMSVNPEGAGIVRLIFHKYGVEKKGTTVIARELREAGYRTLSGSAEWSGGCVMKILKNEKYVGDLVQKKTITPDYLSHEKKTNRGEEELIILRDHHEPVIDRELWDTVQDEIRKRRRTGNRGAGHSVRYALSGRIRCGECGASFVSRMRKRKDGTGYRRWGCLTAAGGRRREDGRGGAASCGIGRMLREEMAMDILRLTLASLEMDAEGIVRNVTEIVMEAVQAGGEGGAGASGAMERRMERVRRKRADALDAFFSRRITEEEMRLITGRYDQELDALRTGLDAVRAREEAGRSAGISREDAAEQAAAVVRGEAGMDALCRCLLDHMVVHRDKRVEVRLNHLPHKWIFVLERGEGAGDSGGPGVLCHNDSPVPISVSNPFNSG